MLCMDKVVLRPDSSRVPHKTQVSQIQMHPDTNLEYLPVTCLVVLRM